MTLKEPQIKLNNAKEQLQYTVDWFIGCAKRRGWESLLWQIEAHPQAKLLKIEIKKQWNNDELRTINGK